MFLDNVRGSGDSQEQIHKPLGRLKKNKRRPKRKGERVKNFFGLGRHISAPYQPEPDSSSLDFGDLESPRKKISKTVMLSNTKEDTPKKNKKSQLPPTPSKEIDNSETDSSYAGSCNEEEELDLFEEDKVSGNLTEAVMSQEHIVRLDKTSFLLESFEGDDEDFIELSQALEKKSQSILCDKTEETSQNSNSNSQRSKKEILSTFSSNSNFNEWLRTCSDVITEKRRSTESSGDKRADISAGRLNDDDLDSCGLHLSSTSEEKSDSSPDAITIESDKSFRSDNSDVQFVAEKKQVINISEDSLEVEILESELPSSSNSTTTDKPRNSFSRLCTTVRQTYTDQMISDCVSSSKSPCKNSQDTQPESPAPNNEHEYDSDSTVPPTPTKVPHSEPTDITRPLEKFIDLTDD